jgi:hypothetical protein
MIEDGHFAPNLKLFDMAELLDHAVVLLDLPMLVVLLQEGVAPERRQPVGVWEMNHVMAQLVFQPRPKQLHLANVSQPGHHAIFRDVHELNLDPFAFFDRHQPVAFHREQEPHPVVAHRLEVRYAAVPAIPSCEDRFEAPFQHFGHHLPKGVVLGFPRGFVLDPIVDRLMPALHIGVVQRDQAHALDHLMVFA